VVELDVLELRVLELVLVVEYDELVRAKDMLACLLTLKQLLKMEISLLEELLDKEDEVVDTVSDVSVQVEKFEILHLLTGGTTRTSRTRRSSSRGC
jgi:hypothetical protein